MESIKKILMGILEVVLIIYVVLISTLLLYRNKFGYTQFDDITLVNVNKSNFRVFDTCEKGDMITLTRPYFEDIKEGDVLYYYTVQNYKYAIEKGKVLKISGDKTGGIYTLDGTDGIDVSTERLIGVVNDKKYAKIGLVLDIIESNIGFLVFVILPILLMFVYQIYNLVLLIRDDAQESEREEKRREYDRKRYNKKKSESKASDKKEDTKKTTTKKTTKKSK